MSQSAQGTWVEKEIPKEKEASNGRPDVPTTAGFHASSGRISSS
jgi:hypothetical protein